MSDDKLSLDKKLYLTVYEAAEYSGIGINMIQSLVRQDDCPFVLSVGRKKMIRRKDFEEFLAQQKKL